MVTIVKTLHVASVVLSLGLFGVRFAWACAAPARLERAWVRILPHVIDSVLLASAIALMLSIQQYPFVDGWLTAKVLALIVYIVAGSFALKRARTGLGRGVAASIALASITYIIAVALTHDPAPFTAGDLTLPGSGPDIAGVSAA